MRLWGRRVSKSELNVMLSERAGELMYSYERFSDGSSEYIVYPYARGEELEGAPMRYRFTREGKSK